MSTIERAPAADLRLPETASRWRWDSAAGSFSPIAAAPPRQFAAADSFLVEDGRVRGWEAHWRRFARACSPSGLSWPRVRAAASATLPREGRWFPRLEYAEDALTLTVRPAPPRAPDVEVFVLPPGDDRVAPLLKGPDLALCGALRDVARAAGGEEALILDDKGRALEGAYTSLLWWEGSKLCTLPLSVPILPGVTRGLLLELAARGRTSVKVGRPEPERLSGREVWLTSALHGIRRVSRWVNTDRELVAGDAGRAAPWQRRLERLAGPIV